MINEDCPCDEGNHRECYWWVNRVATARKCVCGTEIMVTAESTEDGWIRLVCMNCGTSVDVRKEEEDGPAQG